MEGGMTRRRGYVWLSMLMLGIAIVLLAMQPKGNNPSLSPAVQTDSLPTHDTSSASSQLEPTLYETARQTQQYVHPRKKPLVFELNNADSLDLVQLYNIGPVMAHRILRYRTLLGGYYRIEQLKEVYGMDSARYADITPHLTVNPTLIQQLDINSTDIDQLKKHPYLDYYQAKAIVRMREEKGPFSKVSDILNIPIIDNETYKRIEPYLTCNLQPNK